jgi:hypothetical protein
MIADPRGNQLWRQKLVKTAAVVSTIKLFILVITNCSEVGANLSGAL